MILDLVIAGREVRLTHQVRVGPERCTIVLGVHEHDHEEVEESAELLPAALVRLTRLRPRRIDSPGGPVPADDSLLEALLSLDPDVRRAALDIVGADVAWQLGGDAPTLLAIDGAAGPHLLDGDVFRPATNTEIYRRFVWCCSPAWSTPSTRSAPAPSRANAATSEPDGSVHQ